MVWVVIGRGFVKGTVKSVWSEEFEECKGASGSGYAKG
jgi:hypothetical protein